jgi:hypothetical protein
VPISVNEKDGQTKKRHIESRVPVRPRDIHCARENALNSGHDVRPAGATIGEVEIEDGNEHHNRIAVLQWSHRRCAGCGQPPFHGPVPLKRSAQLQVCTGQVRGRTLYPSHFSRDGAVLCQAVTYFERAAALPLLAPDCLPSILASPVSKSSPVWWCTPSRSTLGMHAHTLHSSRVQRTRRRRGPSVAAVGLHCVCCSGELAHSFGLTLPASFARVIHKCRASVQLVVPPDK